MHTILGAVLSVAVIAGAVALIHQMRGLCRYLEADRKAAALSRRPADRPATRPAAPARLAVVTCLRRRFRPYRAACVAGAGLIGSLGTAGLFVTCFDPSAPAAERPPTVRTVTNTITSEFRPNATITRPPDGTVTVVRTPPPAVVTPHTVTRDVAVSAASPTPSVAITKSKKGGKAHGR